MFGSYAAQNYSRFSDLDVVVIVQDQKMKSTIEPMLCSVARREVIELDYYIFTVKDFKTMLSNRYENISKQIAQCILIWYGYHNFIEIMRDAYHERYIIPSAS